MEAPQSPMQHEREKPQKKDRKREKRSKGERKRKRKDGEKHKRKKHKKKHKKHKKKHKKRYSSSSDSDSSESSGSSSSVDVGALQAMLRKARGVDERTAAVMRANPEPSGPAMSSLLSVVPPVSTGHRGGLREESRVYRPFNSVEGARQGDKDEMGRVLVNGARPALSNLEMLDKELHSKEERRL